MIGDSLRGPEPDHDDWRRFNLMEAENMRLRKTLRQIATDCFKTANDEICSEAERRTWIAVGKMAQAAADQ